MLENLITDLKPLIEKVFFPWREIWYEVRLGEVSYYKRKQKEFHASVLWNEEQKIAKLTILEVQDETATLYFEGATIHPWYMLAIKWAQEEIEKHYQEYVNV